MKSHIATVLVSLAGVVFFAALFAYLFLPYRLADGATRFASGYSALAFQTLHAGQSAGAVTARVGAPLRETRRPRLAVAVYQADDWFAAPKRVGISAPGARRWWTPFTDVHYDADDRVAVVLGPLLDPRPAVGLSRAEVEARHGTPIYTLTRPPLLVHDYSEPAVATASAESPPVWKIRRVLYDLDNRVVAVQAYTRFGPVRLLPSVAPFREDR